MRDLTSIAAAGAIAIATPAFAGSPDGRWQVRVLATGVLPDGKIADLQKNALGIPATSQIKANDNVVPTLERKCSRPSIRSIPGWSAAESISVSEPCCEPSPRRGASYFCVKRWVHVGRYRQFCMELVQSQLGLPAAIAAGLLVGVERGYSQRTLDDGSRVAGFRTFGLIGLIGLLGGVAGACPRFGRLRRLVALVVLPLLPDASFGPDDAWNPRPTRIVGHFSRLAATFSTTPFSTMLAPCRSFRKDICNVLDYVSSCGGSSDAGGRLRHDLRFGQCPVAGR
jgi:hypothetical protein